jgi:hypothetical protein
MIYIHHAHSMCSFGAEFNAAGLADLGRIYYQIEPKSTTVENQKNSHAGVLSTA